MAKMNKTQAIFVLAQHNRHASFMANVIQTQPTYKGKAAKYLKYLACMVENGFDVKLALFSISTPVINSYELTWNSVEQIGAALYGGHITKAQAAGLIEKFGK